ncbi:hypothetical protein POTOM_020511 [Populus tomentosa]|uniref:Uncharacterized protein n=1 Tax=Populus tomentosa TaxID=118781 RepID=A0A8X7ZQC0_POPTO|nr:hypothetical protein POTOM_020511 [Populus tomentosa]
MEGESATGPLLLGEKSTSNTKTSNQYSITPVLVLSTFVAPCGSLNHGCSVRIHDFNYLKKAAPPHGMINHVETKKFIRDKEVHISPQKKTKRVKVKGSSFCPSSPERQRKTRRAEREISGGGVHHAQDFLKFFILEYDV